MKQQPKVSVLILNYNGLKWLPKCLSSIAKTNYSNFEVYLIDNGSVDESINYVKKNFPWVKTIVNKRNLGFAEAYNKAIKKIKSKYILLLNNDTEVLEPMWIKHLVDVALSDPNIAAVACKLVSMENHKRLDSVGGMGIPFWRGFVDIGRSELDYGQYDHEQFEPFAFCGGAALINREAFIKAGGFDEKFFLYMEDADLSWRLRLLGYKIAYAAKAKVAHYFSGTAKSKTIDPKKLYYCHRNLLRAIIKNCGSSLFWALNNYFLFSLIIMMGFAILEPKKAIAVLKAILWNIINFKDAYAQRLKIQFNRKISEPEILNKMYPRIKRFQPSERIKLRHILNILFEYSQLKLFQAFIKRKY